LVAGGWLVCRRRPVTSPSAHRMRYMVEVDQR
jgi:hypothetical protein